MAVLQVLVGALSVRELAGEAELASSTSQVHRGKQVEPFGIKPG
jgi:hypothetical protein